MHCCRADILGFLLTSWPEGKIRLRRDSLYLPNVRNAENDTYNGESFGILWELFRAKNVRLKDYEAMLILLLERGESLMMYVDQGVQHYMDVSYQKTSSSILM